MYSLVGDVYGGTSSQDQVCVYSLVNDVHDREWECDRIQLSATLDRMESCPTAFAFRTLRRLWIEVIPSA